jgi:hypothetical protein
MQRRGGLSTRDKKVHGLRLRSAPVVFSRLRHGHAASTLVLATARHTLAMAVDSKSQELGWKGILFMRNPDEVNG